MLMFICWMKLIQKWSSWCLSPWSATTNVRLFQLQMKILFFFYFFFFVKHFITVKMMYYLKVMHSMACCGYYFVFDKACWFLDIVCLLLFLLHSWLLFWILGFGYDGFTWSHLWTWRWCNSKNIVVQVRMLTGGKIWSPTVQHFY